MKPRTGGRAGVPAERGFDREAIAAAAALVLAWAVGGWLVAGAAREAQLGALPHLFHVLAAGAALALGARLLAARRRRDDGFATASLVAAFRELGAGDLVRAAELGRELPGAIRAAGERATRGIASRIERLQASSLSVAGAAEGVERGLAGLSAGATEQAAAAAEVTSAMEELARTAAEISEHAERQSDLVARAEADGVAGGVAVAEALSGVAAVESRIGEMVARADTLGAGSREIFRVLDLISEIAQETHLLSLNAALEASTAGDRGRRFAVVAGEVRQLSERVRDSVAAVRSQIEGFASAIRATVVATEEGKSEASRVLAEARAASDALERLRTALGESSGAARQISGVTRQQTAATEEVVSTLRELRQVVERMSRDLGQLAATARRLHQVGLDLQLAAQSFRLDSPRSVKRLIHDWANQLADAADPGAALERLVRGTPFVEAGYLANAEGRLTSITVADALAAAGAPAITALGNLDLRDRPWYRDATQSDRSVLTPPHASLLSGDQCLTAALARRAADGRLLSVLGVDISVRGWTRIGG